MKSISRRDLLQGATVAGASVIAASAVMARSSTVSWESAIREEFGKLSPDAQRTILQSADCKDAGELAARFATRFPDLTPKVNAGEKIQLFAQGSPSCPYTRSNTHDKDCSHSRS